MSVGWWVFNLGAAWTAASIALGFVIGKTIAGPKADQDATR